MRPSDKIRAKRELKEKGGPEGPPFLFPDLASGSALGGLGLRRRGLRGRGIGVLAGTGVAALRDARRFAGAPTQIIELGAADGTAADDLDRIDVRRIKREDALDALPEADLADGEAAAQAA